MTDAVVRVKTVFEDSNVQYGGDGVYYKKHTLLCTTSPTSPKRSTFQKNSSRTKETTLSENSTIVIGNNTTDTVSPTSTSSKYPNQSTSPKSTIPDTDTVLPTTTVPESLDREPIRLIFKLPLTSHTDRTQTPISSTEVNNQLETTSPTPTEEVGNETFEAEVSDPNPTSENEVIKEGIRGDGVVYRENLPRNNLIVPTILTNTENLPRNYPFVPTIVPNTENLPRNYPIVPTIITNRENMPRKNPIVPTIVLNEECRSIIPWFPKIDKSITSHQYYHIIFDQYDDKMIYTPYLLVI